MHKNITTYLCFLGGFLACAAARAEPFDEIVEIEGIRFHVQCTNEGSINQLTITPDGLEYDNRPMQREVDGSVTGAEGADLNADGSPEIYVYVSSAGSGSYGSLIAYSANQKKSLTEINLPDLYQDSKNIEGYMGHDVFAVAGNVLRRSFPIYKPGDTNAKPTGGTRQIDYKLYPGEAVWQLKIDRVSEY